jgi:alkylhydroperoxidase/carboxymuconolactone decarboxylase family protein YurZ
MLEDVTFLCQGPSSNKETNTGRVEMDDRTQLLICLASAVAANCVPCFDHYYGKAQAEGMPDAEVESAVALANQVKQGGAMVMTDGVKEIMNQQREPQACCQDPAQGCCCD